MSERGEEREVNREKVRNLFEGNLEFEIERGERGEVLERAHDYSEQGELLVSDDFRTV